MNSDWGLLHLRVFCEVYKQQSFVKAAAALGISPAYVSKTIRELEGSLNAKLFNRTTRRVRCTAEGEVAFRWALEALSAIEKLKEDVSASQQNLKGTLRITASMRLGRTALTPILADLMDQYPDLEIWVELVDRSIDVIAEGIDIDLRVGTVHEPHLVSHPIISGKRILCASHNYIAKHGAPQSIQDLASHSCLPFRDRVHPSGAWYLNGPDGSHVVRPINRVGSNNSDVARQWALSGLGIILLSEWDAYHELETGKLVQVLPEYTQPADVVAVTPIRLSNSLKIKVCVDYIIEQLRSGPHALKRLGQC